MAKQVRTIAVVTGTRAELGLLAPVMRAIDAQPGLRLRVVVAGLHLVSGTWRSVASDWGFTVDAKVRMQRRGEVGRAADVQAVGRGVAGFGAVFGEMRPDVVLVLGDRIEAFAAATAASVGGIRVAHVHGGDRAEGVADEAMRHAISKLAHLHYPATALSRRRLVRMGERAEHVVRVGSPAVDELLLRQRRIAREPGHVLVMQHPVGGNDAEEQRWMRGTLSAATAFAREAGHDVLVFDPNADAGSDGVRAAIERWMGRDPALRRRAPQSGRTGERRRYAYLPRGAFLALLRQSMAIVGNSSAGLIEAAVLHVPCVNIGPRQAGREQAGNVLNCDYGQANVRAALKRAAAMDLRGLRHPYGKGDAGRRMAAHLAGVDFARVVVRKRNGY
ncbi:MAG: UDP-N-acetylglucosamine 2-epimerase [Phycisphaeraceae bacterium]